MSGKKEATVTEAQQGTVRPHHVGQDVFRSILSEDIDWKPFAAFPPSVRLAVVVGRPSEAGPYTIWVRVPHDVKIMPHRHSEDRVYTVMSGVFYIGLGDQFDADKLQAYPPGRTLSFCREINPISTGRNPVNTLRKLRRLVRLDLNTSVQKTIRETTTLRKNYYSFRR